MGLSSGSGLGWMAADIVVLAHARWIRFLLSGFLLARERPGVREVHLADLMTNVGPDLAGLDCPLATLKRALSLRFDPAGWRIGIPICPESAERGTRHSWLASSVGQGR